MRLLRLIQVKKDLLEEYNKQAHGHPGTNAKVESEPMGTGVKNPDRPVPLAAYHSALLFTAA